jgi:peptide/nickel transport system permease protein
MASASGPEPRQARTVWRRLRRHRAAACALWVLTAIVLLVLVGPALSPYSYDKVRLQERLRAPCAAHWLGSDELGRDVLTRLLHGGRVSLLVGVAASLLSSLLGSLVGAVAGYYGRLTDTLLMRWTDIMLAIPSLPLLLILSRCAGGTVWGIVVILMAFGWMSLARVVRGSVLSLREIEFVDAARVVGARPARILLVHIVPNALAPILVYTTLNVGYAILAESSLSYLGLGIRPPVPSWGNMLLNAQQHLGDAPWLALFPGLMIFSSLLAINFLGDGLRDALDPHDFR